MPSLDDLGTKQVISGTPASDDLVAFFDVSEFGNAPVKKTTISSLVDATSDISVPGDEEKILKGSPAGNIATNNLIARQQLEVGSEDGFSGSVLVLHSSGAPATLNNDDAANGTVLRFPSLGVTTATAAAIIVKGTTGDPATTAPAFCVNTFDNTFKVYADGAWRTLASGW
jgi:hypothetical protein